MQATTEKILSAKLKLTRKTNTLTIGSKTMNKEYMPLLITIGFILIFCTAALNEPYLSKEWVDRWKKATVYTIIAAAVVVGWILWE